MHKILCTLLVAVIFGCAHNPNLENTGSATGLGPSPFELGGQFKWTDANAIANAIDDNAAIVALVDSDSDGAISDEPYYQNLTPLSSAPSAPSNGKWYMADADNWNPCASNSAYDYMVQYNVTLSKYIAGPKANGAPVYMSAEPGSGAATNCVNAVGQFVWADNVSWNPIASVTGSTPYMVYNTGSGWVPVIKSDGSILVDHDRGDISAFDYGVGDFTTDGSWHDLDLSSIVPSGARFITIRVSIRHTSASQSFMVRKNGNSNIINTPEIITQVSNVYNTSVLRVPCDTGRVIEYKATSGTWTTINFGVIGWEY